MMRYDFENGAILFFHSDWVSETPCFAVWRNCVYVLQVRGSEYRLVPRIPAERSD